MVRAVRGVSFDLQAGQTLGIVGESGSGKSVTAMTILGLARGARVRGRVLFQDRDLVGASPQVLRWIRGAQIAMIFQDPLSSLHPYYRVGWQIVEMIRTHDRSISKKQARRRAADLLTLVGIPQAARRIDDYPHQFSGGMRQRVMIAMAMALDPKVLIADEPTTALDVTVQAQVIDVMRNVQSEFGTSIIMITHDLGVIADIADDVLVMYSGEVMETAPRRELYYHVHHPYTEGLLASLPSHGGTRERLTPIPGSPPSLLAEGAPCPFAPRCRYAFDPCFTDRPELAEVFADERHRSACWLSHDEAGRRREREQIDAAQVAS
ncbi:ABC transporter ATP-binding protein [Microlunatus elymi]|uniref:ABC transporter ATP-binding protein n=2 Tax=Microlunatus elymi TaxID=2596828 RepID=A0A516Q616_9ACTN|nr:ABC transporter ATP-binding protein [Microlunatus elymi]